MDHLLPDYTSQGFAETMGPNLKSLVETQLLADLAHYGIAVKGLKFDWSQSCIEGECTDYLDGSLDQFSGIAVYDQNDQLYAEGWLKFIHEGDFFIVFWDSVSCGKIFEKDFGIPQHVWDQIPDRIKWQFEKEKMKI